MPSHDDRYPYFETRSQSVGYDIEPLATVQINQTEREVVSTDQTGDRLTKTVEAVIEWPVRLDTEAFVDVYKDWLCSVNQPSHETVSDEILTEAVDNEVAEKWVSGFVGGDTGSNSIDYERLATLPFSELQEEIQQLDESVDWGSLYLIELAVKNREAVKEWIKTQQKTSYPIRYESVSFAYLENQPHYPDDIEHLAMDAFMDPPLVSWWSEVGVNMRLLPKIDEKLPNDPDEAREVKDSLNEEYAHLTVSKEFTQQFSYEDGVYEPEFGYPDFVDEVSLDAFQFFFSETVLDESVSVAIEEHNINSKDEVVEYTVETIENHIAETLERFSATENSIQKLDNAESRRSK